MKKLVVCIVVMFLTIGAFSVNAFAASSLPDYEKIDMSAMLSSMVRSEDNKGALTDKFLDADGIEKSLNYASFQLLYGKVDGETHAFELFGGTGMNAANDQVWAYGDTIGTSGVGFWRWQIRARAGDDAIFKIVLKEDCALTIGHTGVKNAWDFTMKMALYRVNEENGTVEKLDEKAQTEVNTESDKYLMRVADAKAGETYYYCISSENVSGGTTEIVPYFVFGDQWKTLKQSRLAALDELYASFTEEDYTAEDWQKITEAYNTGKTAVSAAYTQSGVEDAYKTAVGKMRDVWTQEETAAGVAVFRETCVEELKAYAEEKGEQNYTVENWAALQKIVTDAESAIDELTSKDAILTAVETAKTNIDAVETSAVAVELAAYKAEKKAELESYVGETLSDEERIALAQASLVAYKTEIDAAVDKNAVDAVVGQAKEYIDFYKEDTFVYNMSDMVSATIRNEFGAVDTPYSVYQLLYGKVDGEMYEFTVKEGVGDNSADNKVFDSASQNAGFRRWQLRASSGMDAIMKIEVKLDSLVHITHPVPAVADPWATHSFIKVVAEDSEGYQITVKNTQITSNVAADYYVTDVHAKKGDIVYVVYYTSNSSQATTDFIPQFEVDVANYNEDERPDFSAMKELEVLKESKYAEIDEKVASFNESDYSAANWGQINDIVTEAKENIKNATSEEQINALAAETIEKLDAVPTLSEDNAELLEYKEEKKAELEKYMNSLGEKNYSKENWQKMTEALESGKAKIDEAKNTAGVNTAYAAAKGTMDRIEKKESGCKGAIETPFFLSVLLLVGIALTVKKFSERQIKR